MTTSYPTGLDAFTRPVSGAAHNNPPLTTVIDNGYDAIEALEAKVGVDGSAVATSLDYLTKIALPKGVLGYAEVTANQTGIGAVETDLTGLSVAVTVGTGRRIRISGFGNCQQNTSASIVSLFIYEGATRLTECVLSLGVGAWGALPISRILTPTAGPHTYKLRLYTSAGTVNFNADAQRVGYILVEDIGKA